MILTTFESILNYDNYGLREVIKLEQQERKRSKKLDLSREPKTGTVLYLPAKVVFKSGEKGGLLSWVTGF